MCAIDVPCSNFITARPHFRQCDGIFFGIDMKAYSLSGIFFNAWPFTSSLVNQALHLTGQKDL